MLRKLLWVLAAGAVLAGLFAIAVALTDARYPVNPPLADLDEQDGYRYDNLSAAQNGDELFIILAFSGGGTRAAAFSFGLLEALRDTSYQVAGTPRRLIEEVDVISSVSGGSFTAAYYGLFAERIFEDFSDRFLYRDIEGDLMGLALSPLNWPRLAAARFDRIDLAAEFYDQAVFEGKTFQDLLGTKNKPYLIINATDMTLGRRFGFTQEQFDLLCSDLLGVPVARAVAASSAFPGLLSPLTLRNYSGRDCGREPDWITRALDGENPDRRQVRARDLHSYQGRKRPYIHLVDGGLADNVGLRGPYVALTSPTDSSWSVVQRINQEKVKRILVITANAKTKQRKEWDQEEAAPGLLQVLGFVSSGPMDSYAFDSVQLITESFRQLRRDWKSEQDCRALLQSQCPAADLPGRLPPVGFHAMELSFDALEDTALRDCMEALPTSFSLPRSTVDLLRQVVRRLLVTSEGFEKVMTAIDTAWRAPEAVIDPKLIAEVCG